MFPVNQQTSSRDLPLGASGPVEQKARRFVLLLQVLFTVVALFQLDAPFLSAHNDRQNQTFDTSHRIFAGGWRAVVEPKASFSLEHYEEQPFTVVEMEIPFHGILGWPIAVLTGHERAAVRIVSIAFGWVSTWLLFLVLRQWLDPVSSAAGTAVWALAPLVLQFGQVPMPDIICTAGVLAAFLASLRGRLGWSSAGFLFAILAKSSVLTCGLPILVALLVARNCRSIGQFLRESLAWGIGPLVGLIAWILVLDKFGEPTPWTLPKLLAGRGELQTLFTPRFYLFILACLLPFGLGVAGVLGLAAAIIRRSVRMNPLILASVVVSNLVYILFVVRKIPEPQYLLPPLAWAIMVASFGWPVLFGWWRSSSIWRASICGVLILHALVVIGGTINLKSSRVPNFSDVEGAAQVLPPGARVIAVYRSYGASPAVWLDRNVHSLDRLSELEARLPKLRPMGYTHVVIIDLVSHTDRFRAMNASAFLSYAMGAVSGRAETAGVPLSDSRNAFHPVWEYCEQRFGKLYERPQVAVYSLAAPPATGHAAPIRAP